MAFKFKRMPRASDRFPNRKPQVAKEDEEILSGFVDGIPAKRDEEFFMQELRKRPSVQESEFRKALGAPKGLPGWLELDALVRTYNGFRAFEIDDMSFIHAGAREAAETKVKDGRRLAGLRMKGISVRQIEHLDAKDLETRADAKRLLRKLGI